jgi:LemA protein
VEPLTIVVVVAIVLVVVLLLWLVVIYNRLVRARNAYKNGFAQIDVQLTRRHDLIPNLVETVKGYIKHERETLEAVTAARTAAVSAQAAAKAAPGDPAAMQELAGSENLLTQMLGRMFALSEAYPDLKASQNVLHLQEELASTENRVAFARQAFNDSVMTYNNARETFPANVVAGPFGFGRAALLEIEAPEQRDAPRASF